MLTPEQIQLAISQTKTEMRALEREAEELKARGDRMSHFRAGVRELGILEREALILKLNGALMDKEKV